MSRSYADSLLQALRSDISRNHDTAALYCDSLCQYYLEANDSCSAVLASTRLGANMFNSGKFKDALEAFQNSEKLLLKNNCAPVVWLDFYLLNAFFYRKMNDSAKTDSFARLCLNSPIRQSASPKQLVKLFDLYASTKPYKLSLAYLDSGLNLAHSNGEVDLEIRILNNIGYTHAINNQSENAQIAFNKALQLAKKQEAPFVDALYNNMAAFQPEPQLAMLYLDSAFEFARERGDLQKQQIYLENIAIQLQEMGEFARANDILFKALEYKDSLNKIQKMEAVAELSVRYATEKKSNEIKTLKLNIIEAELSKLQYQRNQNILLWSAIGIVLLALMLTLMLRSTRKSKKLVEKEKNRSDELLLNILPESIAAELKTSGSAKARDFKEVSIIFTDFKEFTSASSEMSPQELVAEINECFKAFDQICDRHQIEKIKTIGDAYMAAGGLPIPSDNSTYRTVLAAIEMADFIIQRNEEIGPIKKTFTMRVGLNTGPAVAGIVGLKKFQYDVWGDAVNTASRMESYGEEGKVNISEATYQKVKDFPDLNFEERNDMVIKGKGLMKMYFVSRSQLTN